LALKPSGLAVVAYSAKVEARCFFVRWSRYGWEFGLIIAAP